MSDLYVGFQRWLLGFFGREWIEYFVSNTMNLGLHRLNPFLWTYNCKALIVDIIQETPTTKTFILLPNQHFTEPVPGQHTEISVVHADGEVNKRCYTLSKVSKNTVAITVKHQPDGKLSGWLHQCAKVGTKLNISFPRGRFSYQGQDKLLFICAGSGVTPCFAIINQFTEASSAPKINMYYRSKTAADTIFREALKHHPYIVRLAFSYSQNKPPLTDEKLADELSTQFPDFMEHSIYLCGPPGFRNRVIQYLEVSGYDMNRLYLENFSPVKGSSDQASEAYKGEVLVHLSSQNQSFVLSTTDHGKTLLESAEANGINMVHGCRSGMCGTCKTKLISGEIIGVKLGDAIYPCVSYPASPEIVLQ